jgi:hypothetical protein
MGFQDEVRAEVNQALADVRTVFRYSVQDLVESVTLEGPSKGPPPAPGRGGWMPVQLGNLRRSLRASTSQMPQINPTLHDNVADGLPEVAFVIAGTELGEVLHLGFTAAYALPVNYGHGSFSGYHFVENASARWDAIVAENDAKVRAFGRN